MTKIIQKDINKHKLQDNEDKYYSCFKEDKLSCHVKYCGQ